MRIHRVRKTPEVLHPSLETFQLRRDSFLATLRDDLHLAFRAAVHHRGFFVLAALTLPLGIGATTAMVRR